MSRTGSELDWVVQILLMNQEQSKQMLECWNLNFWSYVRYFSFHMFWNVVLYLLSISAYYLWVYCVLTLAELSFLSIFTKFWYTLSLTVHKDWCLSWKASLYNWKIRGMRMWYGWLCECVNGTQWMKMHAGDTVVGWEIECSLWVDGRCV